MHLSRDALSIQCLVPCGCPAQMLMSPVGDVCPPYRCPSQVGGVACLPPTPVSCLQTGFMLLWALVRAASVRGGLWISNAKYKKLFIMARILYRC